MSGALVVRTAVAVVTSLALAVPVAASSSTASAARTVTATVAHVTDPDAATAGSTLVVAGKSYAFSSVVAGKPVRWNPCASIHWRANVNRGPVGGLDVLKSAVASVAAATGTTWTYDGTSTTVPTTAALPTTPAQARPVLLGWTDGLASDLLRGRPSNVLGMTRTTWFGVQSGTGTVARTQGAVVALDRTDHLPLRGANSWSAVAQHELGHVMGLAHATDSRQLMAAVLSSTDTGLQNGDRAGLALLGRSQGCVTLPGVAV